MQPRNVITIEPSIGRRREARLRVRLGVRLTLRDGMSQAVLADLSLNGARVIDNKGGLRPGHEAVLQWDCHEAFGQVVWTAGDQCGLCFYEPVARAALIQTRAADDYARVSGEDDLVRSAARAFVTGQRRV